MKKKICKTCDWRLDSGRELPILHKENPRDVEMAMEYCDEHTFVYGGKCKPIWCDECGHLDIYLVNISETTKENPNFEKKRY